MRKIILISLAWLFFGLGFLGVFLPILPTTPFALLSLYLFSKSSPRFQTWLLNHSFVGKYIHDWKESGVIKPSAKIQASILIALSFALSWWSQAIPGWGLVFLFLLLTSILTYILSRPSYKNS